MSATIDWPSLNGNFNTQATSLFLHQRWCCLSISSQRLCKLCCHHSLLPLSDSWTALFIIAWHTVGLNAIGCFKNTLWCLLWPAAEVLVFFFSYPETAYRCSTDQQLYYNDDFSCLIISLTLFENVKWIEEFFIWGNFLSLLFAPHQKTNCFSSLHPFIIILFFPH